MGLRFCGTIHLVCRLVLVGIHSVCPLCQMRSGFSMLHHKTIYPFEMISLRKVFSHRHSAARFFLNAIPHWIYVAFFKRRRRVEYLGASLRSDLGCHQYRCDLMAQLSARVEFEPVYVLGGRNFSVRDASESAPAIGIGHLDGQSVCGIYAAGQNEMGIGRKFNRGVAGS